MSSSVDNKKNETAVLEISKEKFAYMLIADIKNLDQLLDAHFTLTHITGHVGSREEWLNDLKTKRFVYHSIKPQSYLAKTEDQTVMITSKSIFDATIYGGRGTYNLQLTEHYRSTNNQ